MTINDAEQPVMRANPYDPQWVAEYLRPMAEEAAAGGPSKQLSGRLLESIWPWSLRTADYWASIVPPGSDRNGVRSEILWEIFQATRRIEWHRYQVWPALLKARIRGGFTAAWRADDPLTRGQRQARQMYLACVELRTQQLGRNLTSLELTALAEALGPQNSVVAVMAGRSMVTGLQVDDFIDSRLIEPADTPEIAVLRAVTRQGLLLWIGNDLPEQLARQLASLLRDPHNAIRLSARDRRQLESYLPALLRRIAG